MDNKIGDKIIILVNYLNQNGAGKPTDKNMQVPTTSPVSKQLLNQQRDHQTTSLFYQRSASTINEKGFRKYNRGPHTDCRLSSQNKSEFQDQQARDPLNAFNEAIVEALRPKQQSQPPHNKKCKDSKLNQSTTEGDVVSKRRQMSQDNYKTLPNNESNPNRYDFRKRKVPENSQKDLLITNEDQLDDFESIFEKIITDSTSLDFTGTLIDDQDQKQINLEKKKLKLLLMEMINWLVRDVPKDRPPTTSEIIKIFSIEELMKYGNPNYHKNIDHISAFGKPIVGFYRIAREIYQKMQISFTPSTATTKMADFYFRNNLLNFFQVIRSYLIKKHPLLQMVIPPIINWENNNRLDPILSNKISTTLGQILQNNPKVSEHGLVDLYHKKIIEEKLNLPLVNKLISSNLRKKLKG